MVLEMVDEGICSVQLGRDSEGLLMYVHAHMFWYYVLWVLQVAWVLGNVMQIK